ncbi:MAG: hypothetical protein LQ343_006646 [Gyalolechia ehrenbergii]|nr:MAG: hypothetical protein LQ343_006646 [Gyalolechia ehrenbergii]
MPAQSGDSFGSIEDFISYLASVETTVENEVERIANSIDAVTDRISASLRSAIGESAWFPDRKPLPPPPSQVIARPVGYLEASSDWISRHRAITAAVVCFLGTGALLIWRQRRGNRIKRRAKRAQNGQRTEIVVLAGPPSAPLTRSLSLDLERRGFVVYIPVNSLWEERLIQGESKADIHPLHLDITSPSSLSSTICKFTALLDPSEPPKHPLRLASFILLPQTPSPPPPQNIADISADVWSDALTTNLLSPFTLLQAFLPLITSQKSSILFVTPTNTPSLSPPSHALDNVIAGGMERYISTLRKEALSSSGNKNIVQFKLGAFDDASDRDAFKLAVALRHDNPSDGTSDTTLAGPEQRHIRGTPLRELHLEVFDAIVSKRKGTVYVGRGSRMYDTLGKVMPEGLVGWMLGLQTQREEARKVESEEDKGSRAGSPGWERVDQVSGEESS